MNPDDVIERAEEAVEKEYANWMLIKQLLALAKQQKDEYHRGFKDAKEICDSLHGVTEEAPDLENAPPLEAADRKALDALGELTFIGKPEYQQMKREAEAWRMVDDDAEPRQMMSGGERWFQIDGDVYDKARAHAKGGDDD